MGKKTFTIDSPIKFPKKNLAKQLELNLPTKFLIGIERTVFVCKICHFSIKIS